MAQPRFTLTWDSFQQNICGGLGSLQQNEEFVDMTLAADGHFVKVHQLVLSLASPYIKELIKTAQCPNPVILLNRVSFTSLCSILEYIYTGEVVVAQENLEELVETAKLLHIKGLKDMNYQLNLTEGPSTSVNYDWSLQNTHNGQTFDSQKVTQEQQPLSEEDSQNVDANDKGFQDTDNDSMDVIHVDTARETHKQSTAESDAVTEHTGTIQQSGISIGPQGVPNNIQIQYSCSNQGNLQMIMNRYVYYLRYTGKSSHRTWRCTDYIRMKCPASVITQDNIVVKRSRAHIHPFHDKKIAKKVKANSIFSLISEAEREGETMKNKSKENSDSEGN